MSDPAGSSLLIIGSCVVGGVDLLYQLVSEWQPRGAGSSRPSATSRDVLLRDEPPQARTRGAARTEPAAAARTRPRRGDAPAAPCRSCRSDARPAQRRCAAAGARLRSRRSTTSRRSMLASRSAQRPLAELHKQGRGCGRPRPRAGLQRRTRRMGRSRRGGGGRYRATCSSRCSS